VFFFGRARGLGARGGGGGGGEVVVEEEASTSQSGAHVIVNCF